MTHNAQLLDQRILELRELQIKLCSGPGKQNLDLLEMIGVELFALSSFRELIAVSRAHI